MHEILTLQFGQQANYVGTHYWNAQESYFTYTGEEDSAVNHDASFRSGIGADGSDTYTPRTLIYDLKGAFGTLRRENALYELQNQASPAQQAPWSGSTIPLRLPAIMQSPYQQALDSGIEPPQLSMETVRFWSDFNHVFFHPRSIVQLDEVELNSSLMPFEQWQKGDELFENLDREYDLLDRDLRPFLEECDQLQGIQVFSGTDDAWGGFASKYLERISDDVGKGCRWIFGFEDAHRTTRERQTLRMLNSARSLMALDQSASMHIPIGDVPNLTTPRYVRVEAGSRWHTSALQCAAVESITLPTRLRRSEGARSTFDNMETTLNNDGKRRIAACAFSITPEYPLEQANAQNDQRIVNGNTNGLTNGEKRDLDIKLYPELQVRPLRGQRNKRNHVFSCIEIIRGHDREQHRDAIEHYVLSARHSEDIRKLICRSNLQFPLLSSYPSIFQFSQRPSKLNIDASLSTPTFISDHIRDIESYVRTLVGVDEREALCDSLAVIAEEYEEGWMSDDDSEDDY